MDWRSIKDFYLLLGEPVTLSGQELLEAGKEKKNTQIRRMILTHKKVRYEREERSQFLLDASCTLGVQDLEGAKNNVLGVST